MTAADDKRLERIAALHAEGHGDRHIAGVLKITRHAVRNALLQLAKARTTAITAAAPMARGPLELYHALCQALAEAKLIEDVLPLLDQIEHVKLYAKQVRDQQLRADAEVYQLRAERKLGEIIAASKEQGHFTQGHRAKSADGELLSRATLAEVGVDKKLSARAQKYAAQPSEQFDLTVQATKERISSGHAILVDRASVQSEKAQRRAAREQILGVVQQSLPQKKFGVIVADPEWRFEPWSRTTGMDRAADNHYPTSCTEIIAARDVPSVAADDCVLFLWATIPMLPHALLVMAAWGFDYKSHYVWQKDKIGLGYWNREIHELLLIGTRGKIMAPAPGTQRESVVYDVRGDHSAKPECFLEMIETWYPTLPKIELNRRGAPRDGWSAWGNEAQTEGADADLPIPGRSERGLHI